MRSSKAVEVLFEVLKGFLNLLEVRFEVLKCFLKTLAKRFEGHLEAVSYTHLTLPTILRV